MSKLDSLAKYAPLIINIKGEVAFSHISRKYEGKELEEVNQKAVRNGGRAVNKPYCTITIANPVILNQHILPPEVVQIMASRFKPDKNGVPKYYATSKSPNLPNVTYSAEAGPELAGRGLADKDVHLPKELDMGLSVTVGARIFNTKMGVGLGIDYILLNEEVRYYEPNNLSNMLESQGITYVPPTNENGKQMEQSQVSTNMDPQAGYVMATQQQMAQSQSVSQNSASGFMNMSNEMNREVPFKDPSLSSTSQNDTCQVNINAAQQTQHGAGSMSNSMSNFSSQQGININAQPINIYGTQNNTQPIMQYDPT